MYKGSSGSGNNTSYTKEKKFHDLTWGSTSYQGPCGGQIIDETDGYTFQLGNWFRYDFTDRSDPELNTRSNILQNLMNGVGVKERTGRKIDVEWIKGSFTISAAAVKIGQVVSTASVESYLTPYTPAWTTMHAHYMRTSMRMVIVKDLQYMSSVDTVNWNDVFEIFGYMGSIHTEQSPESMNRFKILSDQTFVLDGTHPQTTIPFYIKGSDIGEVCYDSDGVDAATSCGVHVIWASYTANFWELESISPDAMLPPTVVGHTRVCFTDA